MCFPEWAKLDNYTPRMHLYTKKVKSGHEVHTSYRIVTAQLLSQYTSRWRLQELRRLTQGPMAMWAWP